MISINIHNQFTEHRFKFNATDYKNFVALHIKGADYEDIAIFFATPEEAMEAVDDWKGQLDKMMAQREVDAAHKQFETAESVTDGTH